MSSFPVTRTVVIVNTEGLHARPADLLARTAMQYHSQVAVVCRGQRVDAKSTLNLLMLGATQGTEIVIEATGDDAEMVVDALTALVVSAFGEDTKPAAG